MIDSEVVDKYQPSLTIGTVAKKLAVSVQTVRLYEQQGLILPYKSASGHRLYSRHDLDRLSCIREMITSQGLNLKGVKRLMSMIPCWEFKGGLDEDCRNCPAYYEANGPCWTRGDVGPKCQLADCRTCPVYQVEINCNKLKEVIFGHIESKAV